MVAFNKPAGHDPKSCPACLSIEGTANKLFEQLGRVMDDSHTGLFMQVSVLASALHAALEEDVFDQDSLSIATLQHQLSELMSESIEVSIAAAHIHQQQLEDEDS